MNQTQRIKALTKLTANLKTTLQGATVTGLDSSNLIAQLEDRQIELSELEGTASKVSTSQAVIQALDELLEDEMISNGAHSAIYAKKRVLEHSIKGQEKQLARCSEIETALVKDNIVVEAAMEASQRGCGNAKLAALYIANQALAELQEDGTISLKFRNEDGSRRFNKRGDPMTLSDAVDEMVDENPNLFGNDTSKGQTRDNPWLPGQFNLSRQGEIVRTNPSLARQLQAEAGITKPVQRNEPRKPSGTGDNPFMNGNSFNLMEQGRLVRERPAMAKKLAAEAGVSLNI